MFPQMRAEFLLEPVAKADRPRAATRLERNLVTNVDADFFKYEPRWKNVLIISSLFIIIHRDDSIAALNGAVKFSVSL